MNDDREVDVYRADLRDRPIVENLLEFYAYEFSESAQIDVGPTGRFGYEDLDDYWSLDGLHPYLMSVCRQLGGLALVQRGSVVSDNTDVWDMEEFFVMRKYRRQGNGTKLIRRVWDMHPGDWEIRVLDMNHTALDFWSSAIAEECQNTIKPALTLVNGRRFLVFYFNVRAND
jgi:predicted acetyltransferase